MLSSRKKLLAVDIGSHSIKALEVVANGYGVQVQDLACVEIASSDDRLGALKRFVREHHLAGSPCVTSVSGRNVIVRYVPMPKMTEAELKSAIQFEANKYIPFEIDEVVVDCGSVEEKPDTNEMRVVLVAVKRTEIDEHCAMLEEADLVPKVVDIDGFALSNAFDLTGPEVAAGEVVALVDVGAAKTTITVSRDGIPLFTREIYVAGSQFTESVSLSLNLDALASDRLKGEPGEQVEQIKGAVAPRIEELANEVSLSFDFFENESESVVAGVYLSGGSALLPGLDESLSQRLGKPVGVWQPTEGLRFGSSQIEESAKTEGPKLAVAVGLAARIRGN